MRRDDFSYFMRRAAEERAALARSTCPKAAAAHREMAARYAALAATLPGHPEALSA